MKKSTVDDVQALSYGKLTIMLNQRKDKIEENIEQIEEQAAEIEKLKFCLAGYMTDIEKLKDSIRAFESEQKDYEKTTIRLREENKAILRGSYNDNS